MKKWLLAILLVRFFNVFAQEDDFFEAYKNEFIGGININTRGGIIGGFDFKYSRKINEQRYHSFLFEVAAVKHPKDVISVTVTNRIFNENKMNYLFPFRFLYGNDFVLFRKSKSSGFQLNASILAGFTLAIAKPYYILYGETFETAEYLPYDPKVTSDFNRILKRAGMFYDGEINARFIPGASFRPSLAFEYEATPSPSTDVITPGW